MKKIARACWQSRGSNWQSFYMVPAAQHLHEQVLNNPIMNEEVNAYNTIVVVSQHISGATWIHRTGSANARGRHYSHTNEIKNMISRVLKMYYEGTLIGDCMFYKTMSNRSSSNAQYPIVYKHDTGNEYWFITGLIDWFSNLDMFLHGANNMSTSIDMSVSPDAMRTGFRHYGLAECELIRTQNDTPAIHKMWQRVNWLELIKKTLNDNLHNELTGYIGGRYGYAMYKNGKAYMHQYGSTQANHIIDVHPNRITTFDSIFKPVQFSLFRDSEDDDGMNRLNAHFKEGLITSERIIKRDMRGVLSYHP